MRLALVCLLILSGCSSLVHPDPRLLDPDTGPVMGDAAIVPDAGTDAIEWCGDMPCNPLMHDAGMPGTCASHPVGSVSMVTHNDCGFAATQIAVTDVDCPHHLLAGRLTIVCDHMYRTVPVASDTMEIDCDGGTFFCATVLGADGSLTVECTSPGGSSCSLDF